MTRGALLALLLGLAVPAAASDMESGGGNGRLVRSGVNAGGNRATSANGSLTSGLGDAVIDSRKTSSGSRALHPGGPALWFFPGASSDLSKLDDESLSSATLRWSAVGRDGQVGALPASSAYYVRVASYTAPATFDFAYAALFVSTSAVTPGSTVFGGVTSLIPNTTWYAHLWALDNDGSLSYDSVRSTFTTLALAPTAPAFPVFSVLYDSAAIRWYPTGLAPPDASSKTAEGYIVELSSTNFGALLPRESVYPSSATDNPSMSTLTVTGLALENTYYMRVASLNHVGRKNYTDLGKLVMQLDGSTGLLILGSLDVNVLQSTVATTAYTLRNAGNTPVTLRVWASTATAGNPWTLGTSPDIETAALQGLFNSAAPPESSFVSFITGSTTAATASVYAGNQNAVSIAPGASRLFWVRFRAPTSTAQHNVGPQQLRLEFRPTYP